MPIQRAGTPPSSKNKEQTNVLGALSAWTDTGDDIADDLEEKEKKAPSKLPIASDAPLTCMQKFKMATDVDSDHFNMVIGAVIILNAALIGLETEFGRGNFTIFEHLFNTVFVVEMVLRMWQLGLLSYFSFAWYWFDFTLVMTGTLDLWILPLLQSSGSGMVDKHTKNMGYKLSVMRALRIVRLMRVLRVIRLFRMFNQLYLIMNAFHKAFQVVMLIGLLVLIIDYVFAIMLTQGIGHHKHLWGKEDQANIEIWFGTIGRSMQTLFVIMTMADRDTVVLTLIKVLPSSLVIGCLVIYVMITSYTMISLITGIISDSLVTSQQEYRRKKLRQSEDKKRELTGELQSFLTEVLEDERDEFYAVTADDLKTSVRGDQELLTKLAHCGVAVTESSLLKLIDKMSNKGESRINTNHFVDKIVNLHGMTPESEVVDLKQEAIKIQLKIGQFSKQMDIIAEKRWPGENIFEVAE